MKYVFIVLSALTLTACNEEPEKVNGLRVITGVEVACFDNVKYIVAGGLTPKIDPKTKQPELCTE